MLGTLPHHQKNSSIWLCVFFRWHGRRKEWAVMCPAQPVVHTGKNLEMAGPCPPVCQPQPSHRNFSLLVCSLTTYSYSIRKGMWLKLYLYYTCTTQLAHLPSSFFMSPACFVEVKWMPSSKKHLWGFTTSHGAQSHAKQMLPFPLY